MTRATIFAAVAKAKPGVWNVPGNIGIMDEALDRLGVPREAPQAPAERYKPIARSPTALADPAAFYGDLRASLFVGGLKQEQVEGMEALLVAMGAAGWPIAYTANALGTAYLETNKTMQPVAEAYYLEGKVRDLDAWRRKNLRYYPWYGRGYPQTTWERNYQKADDALGLKGALMKNPDLMMTAEVAAPTMVRGMQEGWFTTKKLSDYLPSSGPGTREQHKQARRIINGTDRWQDLAEYALHFQKALEKGGWR